MTMEWVAIDDLRPHPKNPNKHSDEQIDRLVRLIRYQGWRHPIIAEEKSHIIYAGHGRFLAAKKMGLEKIPVHFQTFENEEQAYAFLVSDNSIASWAELDLANINTELAALGPDFDIDLLGIKDFVLEPADKEGLVDEDEVPEVNQSEARTKFGELYRLGEHRLLCGDSTDPASVARLMNGENADMAYCDPPYGANIVNASTGKLGGTKPFGNIGNMVGKAVKAGVYAPVIGDATTETAKAAFNICSELTKTQVFWGAQYYAEHLPPNSGWIVWDKETDGSLGDGELAYTNVKKAIRIFKHKWSGMIKASEHGQRRVHPTQKPIALAEWCFENYGNSENVLDLFLGSGSTLIACEKTNRRCFGMEIDPHYCDVIIQRWEKFTGKKATKS